MFAIAAPVAGAKPWVKDFKGFWVPEIELTLSSTFDEESTLAALRNCKTCFEGNPAAPRSRPAAYLVNGFFNFSVSFTAHRYREAGSKHLWWILPAAISGAHLGVGAHNLKEAEK